MGRDFPGIFGDTVFVNTCPLFDNFYQSFEKNKTSGRHKKKAMENLKKLVVIHVLM